MASLNFLFSNHEVIECSAKAYKVLDFDPLLSESHKHGFPLMKIAMSSERRLWPVNHRSYNVRFHFHAQEITILGCFSQSWEALELIGIQVSLLNCYQSSGLWPWLVPGFSLSRCLITPAIPVSTRPVLIQLFHPIRMQGDIEPWRHINRPMKVRTRRLIDH